MEGYLSKQINPHIRVVEKDVKDGARGKVDVSGGSDFSRSLDALGLNPEAVALAKRLRRGGSTSENTPGLQALIAAGLAVPGRYDGRWILGELEQSRDRIFSDARDLINREISRMKSTEELFRYLESSSTPAGTTGVEYIGDQDTANSLLTKATTAASKYVWTAQPLTRQARYLKSTIDRDRAFVQGGISLRAIYQDSARARPWEREYVKALSAVGGEIRTLASDFIRIILVDGKIAIVADYENPDLEINRYTGYAVQHPGMLALISVVYEQQWNRATPWLGEFNRPETATITDTRKRAILRALADGSTLQHIASKLEVSLTTVNSDIKELYQATGTTNHFGLGVWWATSSEFRLD
ncbi:hypothetical protein [Streptomyces sp. NPDC051546]|uniref:hypothetical protein n=1 Tax=Streptomyces sp. NPDC051546 TaxID=3365655 RepID=UPI0037A6431C